MKKELLLFFAAFVISLFLHLLIIFKIYHPANMVVMPLTIGMVFGWLYTSATIRDYLHEHDSNFRQILQKSPAFIKYILVFILLYSISNFLQTISVQQEEGWVDFELNYNKLRGISGFWLLFYMIGFAGAYLKNYTFQSFTNKD